MAAFLRHITENKKYVLLGFLGGFLVAALLNYSGNIQGYLAGDILKTNRTVTERPVVAQTETTEKTEAVPKLAPPSISVLSPNGGQIFQEGYLTQIKWEMPAGYKANLYLLALKDAVMQKELIAGGLLPFHSPYDWKVPKKDGLYWIQAELVAMDTGETLKTDESDRYFTIKPKATGATEDSQKEEPELAAEAPQETVALT
ncbi:hypothetical protein JXA05_00240, partial [Candidatus Peregrinibacteria bacterium]|nr:hypothetical protein [Candidatus Peregrinibacteria bacterium]